MTFLEAVGILEQHNRWRRGDEEVPMEDPMRIGLAIDFAVVELRRLSDIAEAAAMFLEAEGAASRAMPSPQLQIACGVA